MQARHAAAALAIVLACAWVGGCAAADYTFKGKGLCERLLFQAATPAFIFSSKNITSAPKVFGYFQAFQLSKAA